MPKYRKGGYKRRFKRRYKRKSFPLYRNRRFARAVTRVVRSAQRSEVSYGAQSYDDLNPYDGIVEPVVIPIKMGGMTDAFPNGLTSDHTSIYIERLKITIIVRENDLTVNDITYNFLRFFILNMEDNNTMDQAALNACFNVDGCTGSTRDVSLSAVFMSRDHIKKSDDTGWRPYNAYRATSLSTGLTPTDVPNFVYPFKKITISKNIFKTFDVAPNGVLKDWNIPYVCMLYTGTNAGAPDISMKVDLYYKLDL